ncbi:MAG TPA: hypothetical protein VFY36_12445 [Solirubrobacteraceae bacterium]|nr:hypothetical protein [Solirubrobacteraceae bacterium]
MKRTTTATGLLALAAMLVLGVFAGSASAGGGPNSFFLWTGPLPGLILVLSDNLQVFKATSETEIVCRHYRGHGTASNGTAMTTKSVTIVGIYTSCIANGIVTAEVSPAEYTISADGSVAIVGKPIVVTVPELGCSLKIESGPPNNNLRLLLFLNKTKAILVHVEVGKIASLASGGLCGTAGELKPEGTYRGLLLVSVHGGNVHWVK